MIKTISYYQEEILSNIMKLNNIGRFDCDLTYGNGGFYRNIKKPKLCFDIKQRKDKVILSRSESIPLKKQSLNNIIFDPPFLTYIKEGNLSIMAGGFQAIGLIQI